VLLRDLSTNRAQKKDRKMRLTLTLLALLTLSACGVPFVPFI